MLVGSIMLTACAGSDPQFLAIFLTALFVLGAGAWMGCGAVAACAWVHLGTTLLAVAGCLPHSPV